MTGWVAPRAPGLRSARLSRSSSSGCYLYPSRANAGAACAKPCVRRAAGGPARAVSARASRLSSRITVPLTITGLHADRVADEATAPPAGRSRAAAASSRRCRDRSRPRPPRHRWRDGRVPRALEQIRAARRQEPYRGLFERQRLLLAHPVAEKVRREACVAQLARARRRRRVRARRSDRAAASATMFSSVLVTAMRKRALEVRRECEVEHQVDRMHAALSATSARLPVQRGLGRRPRSSCPASARRARRPWPCLRNFVRKSGSAMCAFARVRGRHRRKNGRLLERGTAPGTGTPPSADGIDTCGTTFTPSRCISAVFCSTTCGPSAPSCRRAARSTSRDARCASGSPPSRRGTRRGRSSPASRRDLRRRESRRERSRSPATDAARFSGRDVRRSRRASAPATSRSRGARRALRARWRAHLRDPSSVASRSVDSSPMTKRDAAAVSDQRADVDRAAAALDRVEVLREGLELPSSPTPATSASSDMPTDVLERAQDRLCGARRASVRCRSRNFPSRPTSRRATARSSAAGPRRSASQCVRDVDEARRGDAVAPRDGPASPARPPLPSAAMRPVADADVAVAG